MSLALGDMQYISEFVVGMLPHVMAATHHKDLETAAKARDTLFYCSWAPFLPKDFDAVISVRQAAA